MYSANKTTGQWRAHGRYIARESAGGVVFHSGTNGIRERGHPAIDPAKELERWQSEADPRLWKLIVSPEFGERLDLNQLTRDLITRMERDLGTKLEWLAVTHFNTEHPHVHVALRGIREDGSALELPRDYVRHGIRAIAEDLCTRQLGHRNQLDAIEAERREIQERRFTSLDRMINRANSPEQADAGSTAEHFVLAAAEGATLAGQWEPYRECSVAVSGALSHFCRKGAFRPSGGDFQGIGVYRSDGGFCRASPAYGGEGRRCRGRRDEAYPTTTTGPGRNRATSVGRRQEHRDNESCLSDTISLD
jgi:hypothetical protein